MKPLRFLSLSLAIGLGSALFAQNALSAITDGKKKCVDNFADELKKFSKVDVAKLEPTARCAASGDASNNLAPSPEQRTKLEIKKGEKIGTSYAGACHASYEAVQLVYNQLIEARKETCEKIYTELDEKFPECLGNKPAESCKENISGILDIYDKGKAELQANGKKGIDFLRFYPPYNNTARGKFQDDLDQLQQIRGQGREDILTGTATPPEVTHSVIAADQGSTTLGDYLKKLETRKSNARSLASRVSGNTLPAASPMMEQDEAKKFVLDFSAHLASINKQEDESYQNKRAAFKLSLENKLDTPGNSFTDNALKYGPAAAPLATSLLGNNSTAAASAIGGSSALPAIAAVGAAGAAGIAMGQKSAASSSLGSSLDTPAGPVITPSNPAEGTEFGGNQGNQAPAPLPSAPLDNSDANKDQKVAEATTSANNGALAAALGGGASLMPGQKKSKNNRDVASAAPSTAAEEALKPFTGDLRPAPRPAAAPDNTGNDVSNLLGKMKDLFNMDEGFGDMPPPDMFGGGPGPAPASGPAAGGDEYVGNDYSGEEEYQADGEYSDGEETYQGSNPMGDIEVTLFRRVHARHVKCMEKGLVILMSQELPE